MYDLRLSDSLYELASQAARAQQVSVEAFVEKAVQQSLRDPEALALTPEQMAFIRKGQADVKTGNFLTIEQVEERSVAYKDAWRDEHRL